MGDSRTKPRDVAWLPSYSRDKMEFRVTEVDESLKT
jgi:hypothetical protein